MTAGRAKRIAVILLCIAVSTVYSYVVRRDFQGVVKMPDFAEIYYGARCAIQRRDPYNPGAVADVFKKENPQLRVDPFAAETARIVVTIGVNLPTTLFAAAPIALLPWPVAQNVWMLLTAGLLALAAFLMWELAAGRASIVSGCLAALALANCEVLLSLGNLAGVAVALCLIAAWCFLRNRFVLAGVVLLAISLVLKPHDSGMVWLYFLLAGGVQRKRALQTLGLTAVLGLAAAIWIAPASPNWLPELRNNLVTVSAPGSTSDPALSGPTNRGAGQIIDLQAAISIFKNDARVYNLISYLIAGPLILVWAIAAFRKRFSHASALQALASISALSLLPIYHRMADAKILLLAIPACAVLWLGKSPRRWIAFFLTAAAIFFTSDIPVLALVALTHGLPSVPSSMTAKFLDLILLQPAPLLLLATGCFYLWAYLRYDPAQFEQQQSAPDAAGAMKLESAT